MPPSEIADAVEMYAREHNRHATLHPFPALIRRGRGMNWTWVVKFTLKSTDKSLLSFQSGASAERPTEDVWLHLPNPRAGQRISGSNEMEPDYLPLDIEQMGPSGVREFLERGNTWSGRGEYASAVDALTKARQVNADRKAKIRAEQKELNRYERRDERRQRWKIPFVTVIADIGKRVKKAL